LSAKTLQKCFANVCVLLDVQPHLFTKHLQTFYTLINVSTVFTKQTLLQNMRSGIFVDFVSHNRTV